MSRSIRVVGPRSDLPAAATVDRRWMTLPRMVGGLRRLGTRDFSQLWSRFARRPHRQSRGTIYGARKLDDSNPASSAPTRMPARESSDQANLQAPALELALGVTPADSKHPGGDIKSALARTENIAVLAPLRSAERSSVRRRFFRTSRRPLLEPNRQRSFLNALVETIAMKADLGPASGQADFKLTADSLPVRWSRSVSKLTFWPSLRLPMPARSTTEMWTKTSPPPPSG